MNKITNVGEIIIASIFLIIFAPFINFWASYFGGWITKLVIGVKLSEALNILFNTTFFTPEKIPMMAGALGFIGGYFKSNINTKRN